MTEEIYEALKAVLKLRKISLIPASYDMLLCESLASIKLSYF